MKNNPEDVRELHDNSPIFDAHNDVVLKIIDDGPFVTDTRGEYDRFNNKMDFLQSGVTLEDGADISQIDLSKAREGSVDCLVFACWVSDKYSHQLSRALQYIEVLHEEIEKTDGFQIVTDWSGLGSLLETPTIAAMISVEGGAVLEGRTTNLRILNRLGVKSMTFTHYDRNALGDGSGSDSGSRLTAFGHEVIEEMNRLGMVVDIAHLNQEGFFDALKISKDPVIVSHANVRGLVNHHRNLTDAQLKKLAGKGGVIGLSFYPAFVKEDGANDSVAVTIENLLDHVDYLSKLIGIDHIGLGSDFDGGGGFPGLEDASKYPAITAGLKRRGYTDTEVEKVLGRNLLRVFKDVLP